MSLAWVWQQSPSLQVRFSPLSASSAERIDLSHVCLYLSPCLVIPTSAPVKATAKEAPTKSTIAFVFPRLPSRSSWR
jgi:hypothetical protein